MNEATVSERLIAFARRQLRQGLPEAALHETKRLLLNQLKASVGATDHPAVQMLHAWAADAGTGAPAQAHVLWLGTPVAPAQAAVVNGALFEVLDFHDTYIPTFMHAVSAVLPAALAAAEAQGRSGRELLTALALGLEIELAVATILMPTGYYRGHVPAGLVGGVGAASACSILAGLDDTQMRNALGLAMCSAFGCYESVGSGALAYITGMTARSGYTAFELAQRGLDAPRTAFEGEKGMFATHCDEPRAKIEGVLQSLGQSWRLFGQSYKTVPTETITHAPVELVLQLLPKAKGRRVERLVFGVEPIVVKIADERRERFGEPKSELEARFDLRHCAAAAWVRGRFTRAEMQQAAYADPAILDLRSRIELIADPARKTFEGAWLEVRYSDGSGERANVDQFLGTPGNPMSDQELGALFLSACEGLLPQAQAQGALQAVWELDRATSLAPLMALCRLHQGPQGALA
jgi:2-methylcitrate dehydratase PrpD